MHSERRRDANTSCCKRLRMTGWWHGPHNHSNNDKDTDNSGKTKREKREKREERREVANAKAEDCLKEGVK